MNLRVFSIAYNGIHYATGNCSEYLGVKGVMMTNFLGRSNFVTPIYKYCLKPFFANS